MSPALNRTDAWFLAALTETRPGSKPMQLWEFINNADYLNRAIPTYEECQHSFARLSNAGLVRLARDAQGNLILQATASGFELRSRIRAKSLGRFLEEVGGALGARPYPEPEPEDTSLGAVGDFSEADWNTAVRRNADWMEKAVRRFLPGFVAPGSSRDERRR